jgi:hypothetical protein
MQSCRHGDGLYDRHDANPSEDRIVESCGRPCGTECGGIRGLQRDDGEPVAVVQVALQNGADRVAECARHREDRDPHLVASRIVDSRYRYSLEGRILCVSEPRRGQQEGGGNGGAPE